MPPIFFCAGGGSPPRSLWSEAGSLWYLKCNGYAHLAVTEKDPVRFWTNTLGMSERSTRNSSGSELQGNTKTQVKGCGATASMADSKSVDQGSNPCTLAVVSSEAGSTQKPIEHGV